jgi:hypothetical protein
MPALIGSIDEVSIGAHYKPVAAIYGRATCTGPAPLPSFGGAGTGGFEGIHFVTSRPGYKMYPLVMKENAVPIAQYAPYKDLMEEVRAGFGRTMSYLPAIFGVSRQTLYNWLAGEIPKEHHQKNLVQLAAAARVFASSNFKPTVQILERTVSEGKSFVTLMIDGADGKKTAERLVRVVNRGAASRAKLDVLMGDRVAPSLGVSDMGSPSLDEWY